MARQILISLFVLMLAVVFSTLTFAQEKKEGQKETKTEVTKPATTATEMPKTEKTMGQMKSITCDPACGFMVRSHDEKEVTSMAQSHVKHAHKKSLSDKDAKEMMKTEEGMK